VVFPPPVFVRARGASRPRVIHPLLFSFPVLLRKINHFLRPSRPIQPISSTPFLLRCLISPLSSLVTAISFNKTSPYFFCEREWPASIPASFLCGRQRDIRLRPLVLSPLRLCWRPSFLFSTGCCAMAAFAFSHLYFTLAEYARVLRPRARCPISRFSLMRSPVLGKAS